MDHENNEVSNKYQVKAWQEIVIWGLTFLPLIVYLIIKDRLPKEVPMHYGMSGEVDRYGSPMAFMLIMLMVGVFTNGILFAVPFIDPKKTNYGFFRGFYFIIRLILALMLSGIVIITFYNALGNDVDILFYTNLSVLGLLLILGNFLGKVRQTWFVGIRTPWTLSSEEVWRKTHRLAGKLLFVSSLIGLIMLFLTPQSWFFAILMSVIGIGLILPSIMSYVWYRKR